MPLMPTAGRTWSVFDRMLAAKLADGLHVGVLHVAAMLQVDRDVAGRGDCVLMTTIGIGERIAKKGLVC